MYTCNCTYMYTCTWYLKPIITQPSIKKFNFAINYVIKLLLPNYWAYKAIFTIYSCNMMSRKKLLKDSI